jgi:hypothetical protein
MDDVMALELADAKVDIMVARSEPERARGEEQGDKSKDAIAQAWPRAP